MTPPPSRPARSRKDQRMLRIGIVGLGFMGKMHFDIYRSMPDRVRVTAISEVGADKRAGDWSKIGGNMAMDSAAADLSGIAMYEHPDELLADPNVDVADITLPTYLHRDVVVKALEAGKHVICEKPMALTAAEADAMAAAAARAGRILLVGQCIRFWPAYVKAREMVQSGDYGRVISARFQRYSTMPVWNWNGWLLDAKRSGLAAMDLHIHDSDFIAHLFGLPAAVTSWGGTVNPGGFDHIVTRYHYNDGFLVTAEGAWEYSGGYPFSMTFAIHMEKVSLALAADGVLTMYPVGGLPQPLPVDGETGYVHELRHFVDCLKEGRHSDIISPEDAAASVRLVEAEIKSAREGRLVMIE